MSTPVAFFSDFGPGTEHVGAMHAVVAAACPGATLIDLAHDIPSGDIRWGAIVLGRLAPLLPGAVIVAVVDPGVGSHRRRLAVELDGGGYVVGPDNGLLGPVSQALNARSATELTDEGHMRTPVSRTFHGRDVFAPIAAHLAAGGSARGLGAAVDVATIVQPKLPAPTIKPGSIEALAVGVDRFGNIALLAAPADLASAGLEDGTWVWVVVGEHRHKARVGGIFADVPRGGVLVHEDSSGSIAVAVNGGNAAERFGLAPGEAVGIIDMETAA
jgi:S-adenosyl-L-methionine hydrolase (adenosine-forming)